MSESRSAKDSLELRLTGKDDRIIYARLELGAGFDEHGRFSRWQFAIRGSPCRYPRKRP